MKKIKKSITLVMISTVVLMYLVSCSSDPLTADIPKHNGPHQIIGTSKLVLDDPRKLLLQVWYPAENEGAGVLDPFISKAQLRQNGGV